MQYIINGIIKYKSYNARCVSMYLYVFYAQVSKYASNLKNIFNNNEKQYII